MDAQNRVEDVYFQLPDWVRNPPNVLCTTPHKRGRAQYVQNELEIEQLYQSQRDVLLAVKMDDAETKATVYRDRMLTDLHDQQARQRAERDRSGHTALEQRADEFGSAAAEIEQRIVDTPARTNRGVAVKLRLSDALEGVPDQDLVVSALEDAERLS